MCTLLPDELLRKPKEGFFKIVVRLGRDFEVLQVLLAVEGNSASLHFTFLSSTIKIKGLKQKIFTVSRAYFHINFVTTKDNGNIFTDTLEIAVPIRHVLVGDSRGNIKHDDSTLTLNVITIPQTTELFLPRCVPDVETDGAKVGCEV